MNIKSISLVFKIFGKDVELDESNLQKILEEYYGKTPFSKPHGEEPYEVIPREISTSLFLQKRADELEEITRKNIFEALKELERDPAKYGRKFKIILPNVPTTIRRLEEYRSFARKAGDHICSETEFFLAAAYAISKGEPWCSLCNKTGYTDVLNRKGIIEHEGRLHATGCPSMFDEANSDYPSYVSQISIEKNFKEFANLSPQVIIY